MEEIRVTEWMKHGMFGVDEYRIWKRFSYGSWHQRHEYKMKNGKIKLSGWIPSNAVWL